MLCAEGGDVEPKNCRLEIEVRKVSSRLWAEVVDAAFEIGFAVRFTS